MARVVLVRQGGVHTIFQIDAGVGQNRPNSKSDVALIQFFLEQSRSEWGGTNLIKMDGICGRITVEAIRQFQNAVNQRYGMILGSPDSAVDPLRTLPVMEGARSTLAQLHLFLLRANPARAYYPFIHKLDAFKADLVPELFRL